MNAKVKFAAVQIKQFFYQEGDLASSAYRPAKKIRMTRTNCNAVHAYSGQNLFYHDDEMVIVVNSPT